jgi:multidrug resistance efflux pump
MMSETQLAEKPGGGPAPDPPFHRRSLRILPVLATVIVLGLAGLAGYALWEAYMAAPWTRDGTVRAYVVQIAPEVAGRIVQLPVVDNQFVRKNDVLLMIDPTNYDIAVEQAQATVNQARANAENAVREAQRRAELSELATSQEERQTYASTAAAAEATLRQAMAALARAQVDQARTHVHAPVNGYVTNLRVQQGDYATVGQTAISIVDTDSFWIDGYFEETRLGRIHEGDRAEIKLMGYPERLTGHVESIARGIVVANANAGASGLANVNPIFTWVRLAQRVPVRIHIDKVPTGVRLVVGQTASVNILPGNPERAYSLTPPAISPLTR